MNFKRVVNLILLIFVAITIFTLVYKELKSEKKVVNPPPPASVVSPNVEKSDSECKDIEEPKKEAQKSEEPKVKKETPKSEKTTKEEANEGNKEIEVQQTTLLKTEEAPKEEKPAEKIIVYYFMTTTRCPSCYKIENYTHSCILDKFTNELNSGKMEWKMINVDEKENTHFVKDYQLFTKSVILSKVVDGKEVEWKNLDKVWDLLYDQNEFYKYIEQETRKFLEGEK